MVDIVYLGMFLNVLFIVLRFIFLVLVILALIKYIRGERQKKENTQIMISLGQRIKTYRIKNNMTQEFVAQSLQVSRQAVSKWETGQSVPSTSNIISLSKLFHIPASELLENID